MTQKEKEEKEEKYVDYDEETACWGIFGVDSGFCYALYSCEEEAKDKLNETPSKTKP